jgi:hypothetical protein
LRKHPYFNFQTAQAVVNFRLKHGRLTEQSFRDLGVFSDEKVEVDFTLFELLIINVSILFIPPKNVLLHGCTKYLNIFGSIIYLAGQF